MAERPSGMPNRPYATVAPSSRDACALRGGGAGTNGKPDAFQQHPTAAKTTMTTINKQGAPCRLRSEASRRPEGGRRAKAIH
mmetsp:Transcript_159264/g.510971  ORF Transcript_159264/g.510971 Transcript_159264/m.510971 type:complete len:82 (-) Transcript_159264:47-292(-)